MKKTQLIHSEISAVIAEMGHTDMLVIADGGLPIPKGVKKIDIALTAGIPSFLDTLYTILSELKVEEIVIAKEMLEISPHLYEKIKALVNEEVKISKVSHEAFKGLTIDAKTIIRTGEFTPYANIILKSGVVF
ncbi:D-ribose pyranase [Natronincola ferrireducens]|uniref:D-ribose pyranase n=1 Tax=Natronincola ferrireducens TaxID=393762 RepID=A0A1G9GT61_9FIRM|nr:D-ribose pyranase [Natronincola ferrireducens]SDL03876.1 D-ribose pyranase [Natronincola ferrireducens]